MVRTFNGKLSSEVVTIPVSLEKDKYGAGSMFDGLLIYSRVIGLMVSGNIDLNEVFNHELAPITMSMFENSSEMRITKSKSISKPKLLIEHSVEHVLSGCDTDVCFHGVGKVSVINTLTKSYTYIYFCSLKGTPV